VNVLKRFIDKLDRAVTNGRLRRAYERAARRAQPVVERRAQRKRNPFCMEIMGRKNNSSELSRLCNLYGSDKGDLERGALWSWPDGCGPDMPAHTYADFYEMLFEQKRQAVRLVIECGVGTNDPNPESSMGIKGKSGASPRACRDYFPNPDILEIDIIEDILFTEERINTYYCDQADAQRVKEFKNASFLAAASVDIIVDDGLPEFRAGKCLFENIFELLKPDGVYIIEVVTRHDRKTYDQYFAGRQDELLFQIVNLHRPNIALWDNSLIVIKEKPLIGGRKVP
jgi:SAM-dependent methyltransferase